MTSRFGALLKRLRDEAMLSQEELAVRSGLGVRTVRRLETGKHGDVRTGTLRQLADALAEARGDNGDDLLRTLQDALLIASPLSTSEPSEPRPAASAAEHAPPPSAPAHWISLAGAIDSLALEVRAAWQREEEQRRVNDPFALPVRWRPVERLADHRANILAAPPGVTLDDLVLDGDLRDIAGLYRGIPSRRLVVLGRAGSGKTILTLRFVLDYLDSRAADERIPVIFSLGSWDPNDAELDEWLVDRLLRDHPGLGALAPDGTTLAAALVEAGCILPVLDPTLTNTLVFALVFGTAAALVIGLMAVIETPVELGSSATPMSLLAANRATALRQLLLVMLMMTLGITLGGRLWVYALHGALGPLSWGWTGGFVVGLAAGIASSFSYVIAFTAWGQWVLLARIVLPLTGWLPWTPVAFLEDAYQRGVLRQAGAVYQFRHARLQESLSRAATGTTPELIRS